MSIELRQAYQISHLQHYFPLRRHCNFPNRKCYLLFFRVQYCLQQFLIYHHNLHLQHHHPLYQMYQISHLNQRLHRLNLSCFDHHFHNLLLQIYSCYLLRHHRHHILPHHPHHHRNNSMPRHHHPHHYNPARSLRIFFTKFENF